MGEGGRGHDGQGKGKGCSEMHEAAHGSERVVGGAWGGLDLWSVCGGGVE